MIYRLLRSINNWYGIVVLWFYILTFVLALAMMFVFPQVTIALLFVGLASLGFTVLGSAGLVRWQQRLARRAIARGACPNCMSDAQWRAEEGGAGKCEACGSRFASDGAETRPDQSLIDPAREGSTPGRPE